MNLIIPIAPQLPIPLLTSPSQPRGDACERQLAVFQRTWTKAVTKAKLQVTVWRKKYNFFFFFWITVLSSCVGRSSDLSSQLFLSIAASSLPGTIKHWHVSASGSYTEPCMWSLSRSSVYQPQVLTSSWSFLGRLCSDGPQRNQCPPNDRWQG